MKSTIWRYGLRAAIVMVALSGASFIFLSGSASSYQFGEIMGYLSMFLAMIFVFLGIRYFRDHQNEGAVSFGQALKLGVLIALFPAISFGIFDQIYVNVINPDFYEDYYEKQVEKIDAPDEKAYEAAVAKIQGEKEMFSNPIIQYLAMFSTVFLVGLVVSIISGLILKREATG